MSVGNLKQVYMLDVRGMPFDAEFLDVNEDLYRMTALKFNWMWFWNYDGIYHYDGARESYHWVLDQVKSRGLNIDEIDLYLTFYS